MPIERRWNRSAVLPVVLSLAAVLAGCKATPGPQGKDGQVTANYRYRRLTADLPPSVRVPAVVAAAQSAFRDRGYAIRSASATEDAGHVEAVPPDPGVLESMSMTVTLAGGGPRIKIVSQPLGDQTRSRIMLDAILARLGR